MAKISRFITTRISAALNADYTQNENVKDCFYLDGRLTRKREKNGADISSTGEDRGFFYSIFASHELASMIDENNSISSLNQMLEAVKQSNDKIDNEINDLADCAVEVGGKATITRPGVRQSYFAGIVVKEGEIAAVARGGACALLFRNNALYPLTSCDIELVNADYHGNKVEHMMDFSAGVAGTIRYSNIAQLQNDDVLILCNKELLEAVGQRKLLDILYHMGNCGDAAAEIVDYAREKNQDDSLQIILATVEEVIPADRTGRINLGLFQNQDNHLAAQETTRYEPLRSEGVKPVDQDDAFKPEYPITQEAQKEQTKPEPEEQNSVNETETMNEEMPKASLHVSHIEDEDDPFKPHSGDFESSSTQKEEQQDKGFDFSDLKDQEVISVDQDDSDEIPVFEPIVTAESKRSSNRYEDAGFADHEYLEEDDDEYSESDEEDAWADDRRSVARKHDTRRHDEYLDQDDDYDYYEEKQLASNVKRNIIYVVLILICLACLFALAKMLIFDDKKPNTDAKESSSESIPAEVARTTNESDVKTPVKKPESSQKVTASSESESSAQTNDQQGSFKGTVYVEADTLNLRSEANTESDIVAQLAKDTILEVIEAVDDGWYHVRTTEGDEGYVLGDYLKD